MGDGSGSEEGDTRGTQGEHDTGQVGTGESGGRSSRVVTGTVRSTSAHPAGTWPSGAQVSSRTPRTRVLPTRVRVGVVGEGLVGALRALEGVVPGVVAVGCPLEVGGQEPVLVIVRALPHKHIRGSSLCFS